MNNGIHKRILGTDNLLWQYITSTSKVYKVNKEATKCSLRNDILDIYDRCKDKKEITHYQLESIKYSSELYFKLKGNSFVKDVVDRVKDFELID